jgi:hypothetical protein
MLRRSTALVAAFIALLLTPALAHATSASMYPAGDTLDAAPQSERVLTSGGVEGSVRCTFDAGAVRIPAEPANRNASGPLRLTLSTNPTFESCRVGGYGVRVTASGTWTAEWAWGAPATTTLNVPPRGVVISIWTIPGFEEMTAPLCEGTNASAVSIRGSWQNGFTSPAFVNSAMSLSGTTPLNWRIECLLAFGSSMRLELATAAVRDATNERAVILVGP